ncbi:MAG: response regulator [Betaproteobacteria bacterium]|nr:response regulator [Betaproteobacteria bacterium]
MSTAKPLPRIADDEIFALTPQGEAELKGSGTSLTAAALKVLVIVDGKASVAELTRGMPVLSPAEVRDNLAVLVEAGYVKSTKQGGEAGYGAIDPGDFFKTIGRPVRLAPGATGTGDAEAMSGLASLREQGYYVRIARRPKEAPAPKPEGAQRVALVVDDDPDIGTLVSTFLRLENFEVVVAANKAQILEALRRPAPPDLALLDVQLPDVDGFHILSRMRQHPQLKSVPIVMLTASATRADILKGLHFGADGYVTKPFHMEPLMKAVRTVLGEDGTA